MSRPFTALLIKEFHEQKWRVLSLCAIYASILLFSMTTEIDGFSVNFEFFSAVHVIFGSIFMAMSVNAGEYRTGTRTFTHALPVRPLIVLGAKLAAGLISVALPIVMMCVLAMFWMWFDSDFTYSDLRSMTKWDHDASNAAQIWMTGVAYTLTAWMTTLWCVAIGAGRRSELGVGMINVAGVLGVYLLCVILVLAFNLDERSYTWILRLTPLGVIDYFDPISSRNRLITSLWALQAIQGGVAALLIAWTRWRFTREAIDRGATPETSTGETTTRPRRIAAPFRSIGAALFWQQMRVARPAILVCGLIFLTQSALLILADVNESKAASLTLPAPSVVINDEGKRTRVRYTAEQKERLNTQYHLETRAGAQVSVATFIGQLPALLLGLIVGVGLFSGDLRDNHMAFWRSRPIPPTAWLALRFAIGYLAMCGAIYLPGLIAHWHYQTHLPIYCLGQGEYGKLFGVLYLYPWLLLATYAGAVAMMAVVRQPVYAGILALGLMLSWYTYMLTSPQTTLLLGVSLNTISKHNPANTSVEFWWFFAYTGIYILALIGVGWWLIKRDAALERWLRG
jgi:hypothetical protein